MYTQFTAAEFTTVLKTVKYRRETLAERVLCNWSRDPTHNTIVLASVITASTAKVAQLQLRMSSIHSVA